MTDQIIKEWMSKWKSILEERDPDKLKSFAKSSLQDEDLFQAITHVLEENERFRSLYNDVIATMFSMFRESNKTLRLFCIQLIPILVYVYLHQVHSQKKCVALETLLRGMYEIQRGTEDNPEGPHYSARLPNINLPSIYHDPGGISTSWLSDSDLDRLNTKTVKTIERPILTFADERVRAPQRLPLCSELWWIFNHFLVDVPKNPFHSYLKTISKLVSQGFQTNRAHPQVRIILSPRLLIEMTYTVYFCVYSGAPTLAEQVLEEIANRAAYQLWADATLVCNAVRNYLKSSELPVQVEVVNAFKKSIITNASFRTKKLPDDIPIVERTDSIDESGGGSTLVLDGHPNPQSTSLGSSLLSKSKSKLPHILSKIKRNSVVVINEEGDAETSLSTPPVISERKHSIDATAV